MIKMINIVVPDVAHNYNSNKFAFVTQCLLGSRQNLRQYILQYTVGNTLTSFITSHIDG